MRNLFMILFLNAVAALTAASLVIDRTEGPDLACDTADIQELTFTDSTVGVNIASIEYFESEFQLLSNSSTTLKAAVLDQFGNLVDTDQDVIFLFVWDPTNGTNINGEIDEQFETLTVTPVNGIASATLNTGDPGLTSISVRTTDYLGSTIEENRIVTIFSTPISTVGLVDAPFSGTNAGAGNWRVTISAICSNDLGMASPKDMPCVFSLVDPTIDWANITGEGYIGNTNVEGQSYTGVAFTDLVYHGSHSLEQIGIQFVADGTTDVEYVELPLNEPAISISLNPANLVWSSGTGEDDLIGEVLVHVQDSQGNPVTGAVINLMSSRGEFIEAGEPYQIEGEPDNVIQSVEGVAIGLICMHWYECPPVDNPPNQLNVDITAVLGSHQLTATTTLIVLNYN